MIGATTVIKKITNEGCVAPGLGSGRRIQLWLKNVVGDDLPFAIFLDPQQFQSAAALFSQFENEIDNKEIAICLGISGKLGLVAEVLRGFLAFDRT